MNFEQYYELARSTEIVANKIISSPNPKNLQLSELKAHFDIENLPLKVSRQAKNIIRRALRYVEDSHNFYDLLQEERLKPVETINQTYGLNFRGPLSVGLKGCVEFSLNQSDLNAARQLVAEATGDLLDTSDAIEGFVSAIFPGVSFSLGDSQVTHDHERQHIINNFIMPEKRYWGTRLSNLISASDFESDLADYFPSGTGHLNQGLLESIYKDINYQLPIIKDEISAFMTDPLLDEFELTELLLEKYTPAKNSFINFQSEDLDTISKIQSAVSNLAWSLESPSRVPEIWDTFIEDYEISIAVENRSKTWINGGISHEDVAQMIQDCPASHLLPYFPQDHYEQLVRQMVTLAFCIRSKLEDSNLAPIFIAISPISDWEGLAA